MHLLTRCILLAASLACAPLSAQPTATLAPASLRETADSAAASMLRAGVPGLSVAVMKGDRLLLERSYGYRDVALRIRAQPDDVYQVGSITKQFTAAAILQLVEAGRIRLDAPISDYLGEFDTQNHRVTVHHLLNHTSGIRSSTSLFPILADPDRVTLLDSIQKVAFDFPPGTDYRYNNSGYYLLGVILENVTGVPYDRYLEEHFFAPLGMTRTSFCGYQGEPIPRGYRPGTPPTPAPLAAMRFAFAAGAICSTTADLLIWQRALVSGRIVTPETYRRMTTPAQLTSGKPMSYGYGLSVGRLGEHRVIRHGGGIPGFETFLSFYPDDDLSIIVLANAIPAEPEKLEEALARLLLGVAAEP